MQKTYLKTTDLKLKPASEVQARLLTDRDDREQQAKEWEKEKEKRADEGNFAAKTWPDPHFIDIIIINKGNPDFKNLLNLVL